MYIYFETRDQIIWDRHVEKLGRYKPYFKVPFFIQSVAANFAELIKIATIFIKTIFKDSNKV